MAGEYVPPPNVERKRVALVDEEVLIFTSMTEDVKEVVATIRESMHVDMHPCLYNATMDSTRFYPSAMIAAMSQLLENKAHCLGFVGMAEYHKEI